MELNDAIVNAVSTDLKGNTVLPDEQFNVLYQAAKDMLAIAEAREKATGGEWRASNPDGSIFNWWVQTNGKCSTGQPHSGKFWDVTKITGINGEMEGDAHFIVKAANIAAKYTGGGDEKGNITTSS